MSHLFALALFAASAAAAVPAPPVETLPRVQLNGEDVAPVEGPDFLGAGFGGAEGMALTGVPGYLQQEGVRYFEVDRSAGDALTLYPAVGSAAASACSTTFFVSVFSCQADQDCMARSGVRGTHASLAADGWAMYTNSPHFRACEKCEWKQNTRTFVKTLEAGDAPLTLTASPFMGIFAAGCGVAPEASQVPTNVGPTKFLCGDYCPVQAGMTWDA